MTISKVLNVSKSNGDQPATSSFFKLNTNFVRSVIQKYRSFNFKGRIFRNDDSPVVIKSKSQIKFPTKISSQMVDVINSLIEEDCLLTPKEINTKLEANYNVRYELEKLADSFKNFHYSVGRIPELPTGTYNLDLIPLLRKFFARRIKPIANHPDLYFLGATKLNINTRVDAGDSESPDVSTKSKTFTVCVAMQADRLYMYEAKEDPSPISSSPNVSPAGSPEVRRQPYRFIDFFKKFMDRMEERDNDDFHIVLEGYKLSELRRDDDWYMGPMSNKYFTLYPAESTFFSPTELFFDQIRSYIAKFDPRTPAEVFSALENIPSVIDEIDCSLYFDDIMNYVKVYGEMPMYFDNIRNN